MKIESFSLVPTGRVVKGDTSKTLFNFSSVTQRVIHSKETGYEPIVHETDEF